MTIFSAIIDRIHKNRVSSRAVEPICQYASAEPPTVDSDNDVAANYVEFSGSSTPNGQTDYERDRPVTTRSSDVVSRVQSSSTGTDLQKTSVDHRPTSPIRSVSSPLDISISNNGESIDTKLVTPLPIEQSITTSSAPYINTPSRPARDSSSTPEIDSRRSSRSSQGQRPRSRQQPQQQQRQQPQVVQQQQPHRTTSPSQDSSLLQRSSSHISKTSSSRGRRRASANESTPQRNSLTTYSLGSKTNGNGANTSGDTSNVAQPVVQSQQRQQQQQQPQQQLMDWRTPLTDTNREPNKATKDEDVTHGSISVSPIDNSDTSFVLPATPQPTTASGEPSGSETYDVSIFLESDVRKQDTNVQPISPDNTSLVQDTATITLPSATDHMPSSSIITDVDPSSQHQKQSSLSYRQRQNQQYPIQQQQQQQQQHQYPQQSQSQQQQQQQQVQKQQGNRRSSKQRHSSIPQSYQGVYPFAYTGNSSNEQMAMMQQHQKEFHRTMQAAYAQYGMYGLPYNMLPPYPALYHPHFGMSSTSAHNIVLGSEQADASGTVFDSVRRQLYHTDSNQEHNDDGKDNDREGYSSQQQSQLPNQQLPAQQMYPAYAYHPYAFLPMPYGNGYMVGQVPMMDNMQMPVPPTKQNTNRNLRQKRKTSMRPSPGSLIDAPTIATMTTGSKAVDNVAIPYMSSSTNQTFGPSIALDTSSTGTATGHGGSSHRKTSSHCSTSSSDPNRSSTPDISNSSSHSSNPPCSDNDTIFKNKVRTLKPDDSQSILQDKPNPISSINDDYSKTRTRLQGTSISSRNDSQQPSPQQPLQTPPPIDSSISDVKDDPTNPDKSGPNTTASSISGSDVPNVVRVGKIEKGYVKFFSSEKGYGFIIPDNEAIGEEIFVHYSTIRSKTPFRSLAENERVEFEIIKGPKGYQAINVTGPEGEFVQGDPEADLKFKLCQLNIQGSIPVPPSGGMLVGTGQPFQQQQMSGTQRIVGQHHQHGNSSVTSIDSQSASQSGSPQLNTSGIPIAQPMNPGFSLHHPQTLIGSPAVANLSAVSSNSTLNAITKEAVFLGQSTESDDVENAVSSIQSSQDLAVDSSMDKKSISTNRSTSSPLVQQVSSGNSNQQRRSGNQQRRKDRRYVSEESQEENQKQQQQNLTSSNLSMKSSKRQQNRQQQYQSQQVSPHQQQQADIPFYVLMAAPPENHYQSPQGSNSNDGE